MILDKSIDHLKDKHPEYSEEDIKLVLESFYDGFRYYLTHPLETKGGILVNGLITVYMKAEKVRKFIEKIKLGITRHRDNITTFNLEFYQQLLQNIEDNERQAKLKVQRQRPGERVPNGSDSDGETTIIAE